MNKPLTVVLGASTNEERYSNKAIRMLVENGHNVQAIGVSVGIVSGIEIKSELVLDGIVDTFTIYLNPKLQEIYYDFVLSSNPKRVIFNPGTENPVFEKMLVDAGIEVEKACTLVMLLTKVY